MDEPIYRRLPCFLIATVDKFAAMPWTGQVGGFFGRVDRYDKQGFYGPCDPQMGRPLPGPLQPPDLIIQDELHLISGPLGTMVGLYETALDELCAREVDGKKVRPKIIASTATVRRAEGQIRALFNRAHGGRLPAAGPGSPRFVLRPDAPAGRKQRPPLPRRRRPGDESPKVMLLRVYLALLGAAQKAYRRGGRREDPGQPGRLLHDAPRLLQQPARAGRQPAHRRGRGRTPACRTTPTASASAKRRGSSRTARSPTKWSS